MGDPAHLADRGPGLLLEVHVQLRPAGDPVGVEDQQLGGKQRADAVVQVAAQPAPLVLPRARRGRPRRPQRRRRRPRAQHEHHERQHLGEHAPVVAVEPAGAARRPEHERAHLGAVAVHHGLAMRLRRPFAVLAHQLAVAVVHRRVGQAEPLRDGRGEVGPGRRVARHRGDGAGQAVAAEQPPPQPFPQREDGHPARERQHPHRGRAQRGCRRRDQSHVDGGERHQRRGVHRGAPEREVGVVEAEPEQGDEQPDVQRAERRVVEQHGDRLVGADQPGEVGQRAEHEVGHHEDDREQHQLGLLPARPVGTAVAVHLDADEQQPGGQFGERHRVGVAEARHGQRHRAHRGGPHPRPPEPAGMPPPVREQAEQQRGQDSDDDPGGDVEHLADRRPGGERGSEPGGRQHRQQHGRHGDEQATAAAARQQQRDGGGQQELRPREHRDREA